MIYRPVHGGLNVIKFSALLATPTVLHLKFIERLSAKRRIIRRWIHRFVRWRVFITEPLQKQTEAFRLKIHRFLGSLAGIIYAADVKFEETTDGSRIFHVEVSGTAKVLGGTHMFVV